jgi:hypothetical protein
MASPSVPTSVLRLKKWGLLAIYGQNYAVKWPVFVVKNACNRHLLIILGTKQQK